MYLLPTPNKAYLRVVCRARDQNHILEILHSVFPVMCMIEEAPKKMMVKYTCSSCSAICYFVDASCLSLRPTTVMTDIAEVDDTQAVVAIRLHNDVVKRAGRKV